MNEDYSETDRGHDKITSDIVNVYFNKKALADDKTMPWLYKTRTPVWFEMIEGNWRIPSNNPAIKY
mgnify:CR=1 FL=1